MAKSSPADRNQSSIHMYTLYTRRNVELQGDHFTLFPKAIPRPPHWSKEPKRVTCRRRRLSLMQWGSLNSNVPSRFSVHPELLKSYSSPGIYVAASMYTGGNFWGNPGLFCFGVHRFPLFLCVNFSFLEWLGEQTKPAILSRRVMETQPFHHADEKDPVKLVAGGETQQQAIV